ncbi:MAG: methylenetetrahydrofolate reductase C-terminal domain-containing protein [Candidatus Omnitrophica bacterium]|nr:methylenetetrahydrofolate reductase C-terminal domain-containing protein [Candidatus Omnitrophota bacterium]
MIITEQKPLSEIIEQLKGYQDIFLVGCGECATTCKTGGQAELDKLKILLEQEGKKITGSCIPPAPCVASQIKTEFAKNIKALRQTKAILVLACGLGAQSVKDNDRMGLAVIPGLNTLCGAVMDAQGDFYEKCSMCGECVLSATAAICPITLCPKGLLNGPCGGMDKGKCEVNKDRDCAWVCIYQELKKNDRLAEFKKVHSPKDYKRALKPHKIAMTRKEGWNRWQEKKNRGYIQKR